MRIAAFGFLAVLGSGIGAAQAAPVAAPVVAEPVAEKDGLRISISASRVEQPANAFFFVEPPEKPQAWLDLMGDDLHINVVLQNTTEQALRIFTQGNSWGFSSLNLEITEVDGKAVNPPRVIARAERGWFGNMKTTELIPPKAALVREVSFQNKDEQAKSYDYGNFPLPAKGKSIEVTMRAVFSNNDGQSQSGQVWTGKIASPLQNYAVSW